MEESDAEDFDVEFFDEHTDGFEDFEPVADKLGRTSGKPELKESISKAPQWAAQHPMHYNASRSTRLDPSLDEEEARCCQQIYGHPSLLDHATASVAGPSIRLLQIMPDVKGSPLRGNLITRPVFDTPQYIALSYTWGTSVDTREVLIGKIPTPLFVTVHLWEALNRLRDEESVVAVWVDAICINQDNLIEKAMQIQIMSQIYNQASEVRIWLGVLPQLFEHGISELDFFNHLCANKSPWWKRLWVVQECAYARVCPVVMLGDVVMTLEALVSRWAAFLDTLQDASGPRLYQSQIDTLTSNLEHLRMPLETWRARDAGSKPSLVKLLTDTSGRQYTVPNDRVYALLSLVDESEAEGIVPDYSIPFAALESALTTRYALSEDWVAGGGSTLLLSRERDMSTAIAGSDVHLNVWLGNLEESSRTCNIKTVRTLLSQTPWLCSKYRASKQMKLNGGILLDAIVSAAASGHTQVVRILLERDADPQRQSSRPSSHMRYQQALVAASWNGHAPVAGVLLDHLEGDGDRQVLYNSILTMAVQHANLEIVELLLNRGILQSIEHYALAGMLLAARRGEDAVVVVDKDGTAVCMEAEEITMRTKQTYAAKLSVAVKANTHAGVIYDGILDAATNGKLGMLKLLLRMTLMFGSEIDTFALAYGRAQFKVQDRLLSCHLPVLGDESKSSPEELMSAWRVRRSSHWRTSA